VRLASPKFFGRCQCKSVSSWTLASFHLLFPCAEERNAKNKQHDLKGLNHFFCIFLSTKYQKTCTSACVMCHAWACWTHLPCTQVHSEFRSCHSSTRFVFLSVKDGSSSRCLQSIIRWPFRFMRLEGNQDCEQQMQKPKFLSTEEKMQPSVLQSQRGSVSET